MLALGVGACAAGEGADAADADLATEVAVEVAAGDGVSDRGADDACAAQCPLARCGADDGCGGSCAPCPSEVSCPSCPLVLRVIERSPPFLRLALDFEPADGAALPSLADLRLAITGDATLLELGVGEPITAAGKAPFADPRTGGPWQELGDGTIRVSLGSVANDEPIGGGRWLVYRFRLGGAFTPLEAPVTLRLSTDEPVFAPPGAASQLWGQAIEAPVAVWPEAR
ncbi:MAG: hypothetical protein R3F39_23930 [Myxococcota bacterium]